MVQEEEKEFCISCGSLKWLHRNLTSPVLCKNPGELLQCLNNNKKKVFTVFVLMLVRQLLSVCLGFFTVCVVQFIHIGKCNVCILCLPTLRYHFETIDLFNYSVNKSQNLPGCKRFSDRQEVPQLKTSISEQTLTMSNYNPSAYFGHIHSNLNNLVSAAGYYRELL